MPGMLKWLSAKLNCTSQIASLLAATSASDIEVVRGIIAESPDLGLYNTQGGLIGGRSALSIAAERGDVKILQIIYEGAVKARGEAFARQSLNSGAERGQTPLMRACTFGGQKQHVECVKYLLAHGADPFAENDKGETCLHIAAKMAYAECLTELLVAEVSIGGCPPVRLAEAVLPYSPPVHFLEMRNAAGFTALHLATLKNSPASMQVLLGAGASLQAGILDVGNTPTLARGSTALHIAAARGCVGCCRVLLDFELQHPDLDLRRIRNSRNLKASQLARLAGHEDVVALLKAHPPRPAPLNSRERGRASRRRRRRASTGHHHHEHGHHRQSISPEAVMDILVARTQLLLALRQVGLELGIQELPKEGLASVQAAHPVPGPDEPAACGQTRDEVAAAVAEFTDLWLKGRLEESESGSLLSSMVPADLQVAKLPESILGDSDSSSGVDSFSAAALVQAALNAMAHFSQSAKPLDLPPTQLKPTSPLAAAVVVQVAIRKLAGKGSTYSTTSAASLINSMHHSPSPAGRRHNESLRNGDKRPKSKTSKPAGVGGRHRGRESASQAQSSQQGDQRRLRVNVEARTVGAQKSSAAPELPDPSGVGDAAPAAALSHPDSPCLDGADFLPLPSEACVPLSEAAIAANPSLSELPEGDRGVASWEGYQPGFEESGEETGMPMWEGYDLGMQDSDTQSLHAAPQSPQQHPSSHDLKNYSSQIRQKDHTGPNLCAPDIAHSPLKGVPRSRKVSGTDHSALASSSSSTSVHASGDRGKLQSPGAEGMDRKASMGSAGLLSPSETSCSTPVGHSALLLATQLTSATEENDSGQEEWDGADVESRCAICMDQPLQCAVSPCLHQICYGCAYQLCSRGLNIPTCPFCRGSIATFISSVDSEGQSRDRGEM